MKIRKFLLSLFAVLMILMISAGGAFVFFGYQAYRESVNENTLTEKFEQIRSDSNFTAIDSLPETYKAAVLASEDHRFYSHPGIDPIALMRALIHDIQAMSYVEGGSTITQQIAKNEFFTQDKELTRKIAEIFAAFKIEQNYSKDDIFEVYVNSIYFGNGYYGIREASVGYFGKEPKDLNDYECTLLAGVPNAPSVYAPTSNSSLPEQRRQQVVSLMTKHGYALEY